LVKPLYKYFDDEKWVNDELWKMAQAEKNPPRRLLFNLYSYLGIGPAIRDVEGTS
jgi:hypothetical protein